MTSDLPQRTRARHVQQPGIHTIRMKLMATRQHTDILSLLKVIRADGASEAFIRSGVLRGHCAGCYGERSGYAGWMVDRSVALKFGVVC